MFRKLKKHKFLLEELVKRDFKHKYKGTVLGVGWSLLSPLLTLLVLKVVFTQFFGRDAPHYTTYLFAGILVFGFFAESSFTPCGRNAVSVGRRFAATNTARPPCRRTNATTFFFSPFVTHSCVPS